MCWRPRPFLGLALCSALAFAPGCHTPKPAESGSVTVHGSYDQEIKRQNYEEGQEALVTVAADALLYPFFLIGDYIQSQTDHFEGRTPAAYARMMDSGATPDERRYGLAALVTRYDFTHRPPYTTRYRQIAVNDPDFTVRAMAIRALNICRDAGATPIFIAALDDREELVRLEAAKALANVPDPNAIQPLLRMVEGRRPPALADAGDMAIESKDVRIAAADALRHYPTLDVARTLVSVLSERDFGVAWQSRRSLVLLTRHDLRYDQSAWLTYLAGSQNPFG